MILLNKSTKLNNNAKKLLFHKSFICKSYIYIIINHQFHNNNLFHDKLFVA
jgi:hypothetical protein